MTTIDTQEGIDFFLLAARKGALGLELRGLKRRGRSAYALCREIYGLRGTRQAVYDQVCALVEQAIRDRAR